MNKRVWRLLALLGVFAVLLSLLVFVIIPKTAGITLPYKWNNVPLGQPMHITRQYLGQPADTTIPKTDGWVARRENGEYLLQLHYNSDSISTSYQLFFNYHWGFFHKQYLLVEK